MGVEDYDWELNDAVPDLLDEGELEKNTPGYGVAQQVIHQGYDSLSKKQRYVYDTVLVPLLKERGLELATVHILNRVGIDD